VKKSPVRREHALKTSATGPVIIKRFPLYDDKDIGLGVKWMQECQIEARMDDDVDTDDDVMNNALNACANDTFQTKQKLKMWAWD